MVLKIGAENPKCIVYCENKPNIEFLGPLHGCTEILVGDTPRQVSINKIVEHNGNHWRKIFNIYSKIAWALFSDQTSSWQQYREQELLREGSDTLLVTTRNLEVDLIESNAEAIHLVMGKDYFRQMLAMWPTNNFKVEDASYQSIRAFKLNGIHIVNTPYFDYRQFPNKAIDKLVAYFKMHQYSLAKH
jgi:hypothetical protein